MQALGILTRLWMWAAVLRIVKHVIALPTLVAFARVDAVKSVRRGDAFERTLARYLERRDRFPFRAPGNCLERSLGAYRLLSARGRRPDLVVGMASGVRGHVWVEVDGRPFGERAGDLEGLARIVTFDADGNQRTAAGFSGTVSAIRMP